jgi:hypothetical protein
MSEMNPATHWTRLVWLLPLAAIVYVLGQAVSGMALAATPLEPPHLPASPGWGPVTAVILVLGIAPIACRLSGELVARSFVLAAFLYLVHTANTAIEMTVFTKIGGEGYMAIVGLLPALLCGATVATVRPVGGTSLGLVTEESGGGLAWRMTIGWLAFPAAYFVFGIMISPLVIEPYTAEGSMIVLPPIQVVIVTQAIRSMLYLLPTLAVMERWTGTRLELWLALGWAHWALVGLSGLVVPNAIMAPRLRLIHSLEIGADSFLYVGILVGVFANRSGRGRIRVADSPCNRSSGDSPDPGQSGILPRRSKA